MKLLSFKPIPIMQFTDRLSFQLRTINPVPDKTLPLGIFPVAGIDIDLVIKFA